MPQGRIEIAAFHCRHGATPRSLPRSDEPPSAIRGKEPIPQARLAPHRAGWQVLILAERGPTAAPQRASALSLWAQRLAADERIRPPEPRKPGEVAIRRTERGAVFEGDCGKNGVHDERTGGLALAHKAAQDVPVPLARLENAGGGLGEPGGDRRFGLGSGKRTLE